MTRQAEVSGGHRRFRRDAIIGFLVAMPFGVLNLVAFWLMASPIGIIALIVLLVSTLATIPITISLTRRKRVGANLGIVIGLLTPWLIHSAYGLADNLYMEWQLRRIASPVVGKPSGGHTTFIVDHDHGSNRGYYGHREYWAALMLSTPFRVVASNGGDLVEHFAASGAICLENIHLESTLELADKGIANRCILSQRVETPKSALVLRSLRDDEYPFLASRNRNLTVFGVAERIDGKENLITSAASYVFSNGRYARRPDISPADYQFRGVVRDTLGFDPLVVQRSLVDWQQVVNMVQPLLNHPDAVIRRHVEHLLTKGERELRLKP